MGFWASIRGEPFLRLRDETFADCKDATVHQDPKRWACGRCSETSSFFFVCVTRPVPTVGMQTVHQDPKRWACGRRYEANPSSVSAVRLSSTRWVHVGPCCTICVREQATYTVLHQVGARGTMLHHLRKRARHVTAASVCGHLLQRESKPNYRDTNLLNSTRSPPGRWHHVAAFIAAAAAVFVSFRRAHHEQQEEHDGTRKSHVKTS